MQLQKFRSVLLGLTALLVLAACAPAPSQPTGPTEQELQLTEMLGEISSSLDALGEDVVTLQGTGNALSGRLEALEGAQDGLVFDAFRVGPSRAQFLPNPPEGLIAVQFLAEAENSAIPGEFKFHLAPEGTELFETLSLPEGEELITGPQLDDGLAFVEPGVLYRLQVAYQNPTDQEVNFLVRGGVLDPQAALPYVRNRCWCASIPFSVPANGSFSRIIDVGVGPDTPIGAKAIVVFQVVGLEG
jgi:hypothetical protein